MAFRPSPGVEGVALSDREPTASQPAEVVAQSRSERDRNLDVERAARNGWDIEVPLKPAPESS